MAWDDDTIDDPDTLPDVAGVPVDDEEVLPSNVLNALAGEMRHTDLTTAERVEVVRRLVAAGTPYRQIGEILHWPPGPKDKPGAHSAIQVFCSRNGIGTKALSVRDHVDA
jgi:hypothetical protein